MSVNFLRACGQAGFVVVLLFLASCDRGAEDVPVIPPPTNPMSREYLGFGVVNGSFVHIVKEPLPEEPSLGFLRKGSTVKVLERRSLGAGGEAWVMVEGVSVPETGEIIQGWLREAQLDVYSNEERAKTAAEAMLP